MKIFDRMKADGVSRLTVTQENVHSLMADEDAILRDMITTKGHQEVHFCQDADVNLRCILGVHNTNRGPALGGCRMNAYAKAADSEAAGLIDVLRLSEGMTYKNALAELPLGGGKAVIVGNPREIKSEEMLRRFAAFVNELEGKYITAEDSGTTLTDINIIDSVTDYVTGTGAEGTGSGDPSPRTAFGVYKGLLTSLKEAGLKSKNLVVAFQGAGNVGHRLLFGFPEDKPAFDSWREEFPGLMAHCDKIIFTDIDEGRIERVLEAGGDKVEFVEPDQIYDVDGDIFSPNALGGVVTNEVAESTNVKLIAGASNNQLKGPEAGRILHERGVLYAPDYAINAGGAINIIFEMDAEKSGSNYNSDGALTRIAKIEKTMELVYTTAREKGIPTFEAADLLARLRFATEHAGA